MTLEPESLVSTPSIVLASMFCSVSRLSGTPATIVNAPDNTDVDVEVNADHTNTENQPFQTNLQYCYIKIDNFM